jgi:hypothetical protein
MLPTLPAQGEVLVVTRCREHRLVDLVPGVHASNDVHGGGQHLDACGLGSEPFLWAVGVVLRGVPSAGNQGGSVVLGSCVGILDLDRCELAACLLAVAVEEGMDGLFGGERSVRGA